MFNVHIPERLYYESMKEYKERRIRSKEINERLTLSQEIDSKKKHFSNQKFRKFGQIFR